MSNTSPVTATPSIHISATRLKLSQYNVAITCESSSSDASHASMVRRCQRWALFWSLLITFRNVSQMEGCCLWHNVDSSIFCSQDLKLHFCHCKRSATHHQSLRQRFLAERTRGAAKNCVRFSYWSEKACSGWMAGGESWEFISGLQNQDQSVPEPPDASNVLLVTRKVTRPQKTNKCFSMRSEVIMLL